MDRDRALVVLGTGYLIIYKRVEIIGLEGNEPTYMSLALYTHILIMFLWENKLYYASCWLIHIIHNPHIKLGCSLSSLLHKSNLHNKIEDNHQSQRVVSITLCDLWSFKSSRFSTPFHVYRLLGNRKRTKIISAPMMITLIRSKLYYIRLT